MSNVTISTRPTENGTFSGGVFTPNDQDSTANANTADIANRLNAGTSVTVQSGAGVQDDDIQVQDGIVKSGGGTATLTLDAFDDVIVDSAIASIGALNIALNATNNVVNGVNDGILLNGPLNANGGNVQLTTNGGVTQLSGPLSANILTVTALGAVALNSPNFIDVLGASNGQGFSLNDVAGGLIIDGPVSGGSGDTSITTGGGSLGINSVVSGANVTLAATGGNTIFLDSAPSTSGTLTLNTTGLTAINVALSGLGNLVTDGLGTTAINGGSVTTTGGQTYNDTLTLNGPTTLTSTSAGDIRFDGTTTATGSLTVSASVIGDGAIRQGSGAITAQGTASFTAIATILDNAANDFQGAVGLSGGIASLADINNLVLGTSNLSGSGTLHLTAGGAITQTGAVRAGQLYGSASSVTLTDATNDITSLGPFTATAGAFNLNETGVLIVSGVQATAGVSIATSGFLSVSGAVNTTGSGAADTTVLRTTGVFAAESTGVDGGDIQLNASVGHSGATTTIASAGRISNAASSGSIIGSDVSLTATFGIAARTNTDDAGTLTFDNATSGIVSIVNTGSVRLGASSNAGGDTTGIRVSGSMEVVADFVQAGTLLFLAGESSSSASDNLTLGAGIDVRSTAGEVNLIAGEGFSLDATATVQAASNVLIRVDDDQDATGETVDLQGSITAGGIASVTGGNQGDTFNVRGAAAGSALLLFGADGSDTLNFDAGNATIQVNGNQITQNGRTFTYNNFEQVNFINAAVQITAAGTTGPDALTLTATDANSGSYTLNGVTTSFSNLQSFTFNGGDGDDTLTVDNTAALFAPASFTFNGNGQASPAPGDNSSSGAGRTSPRPTTTPTPTTARSSSRAAA